MVLPTLLSPLFGTWLGAFLGHCVLIPLWTLSPVPLFVVVALLCCGGTLALVGLVIAALFTLIMLVRLPYQPWVVKLFYDLDLPRFYRKCELRGHLSEIATERTLFMFHPHGILACGFTINGCWNRHFNGIAAKKDLDTPRSSGTVFIIARNLREWAPLFKILCDLSGRLESATKGTIQKLMARGRNLAIIPGGFEDATLTCFDKHRTMLSPRKGLIKYALQHGYAVTPVYSFGENSSYVTFTPLLKQRLALNKQSIPGVLFFGWWLVPLFPRLDSEILTYVGPPLQMPTIAEPTSAQIDEWHAKYVTALVDLFDAHKAEVGQPDAKLEIW